MKSAVSENDTRSSLDTMWLAYRRAVAAGVGNHLKTLVSPHVVALVLYCRITKGNLESGEGVEVAATSTYGYDANGNFTSTLAGATNTTYDYNYLNQLTSIATNGATSTTFVYDAFGNRVSQTVNGVTTVYPSKYLSIVSSQVGSSTLATSTEFLYDPGQNGQNDTLLAEVFQNRMTPPDSMTSLVQCQ